MRVLMLFISLICAFNLSAADVKVNINTDTKQQLDDGLIGIGPKKAEAIIEYREEHGHFGSAYDLAKVHGIGSKTVEKNLDRIIVTDEQSATAKVEGDEKKTDDTIVSITKKSIKEETVESSVKHGKE